MQRLLQALLISMLISIQALGQTDPLPSWNEGPVKQSIIQFVTAVTTPGNDFVPPADRIATFDNDGTLWAEKPLIQGLFAIFRVHRMVAQNPALKNQQPYKAVIEKDKEYFEKAGLKEVIHLVNLTHAGMTATAFAAEVQLFFNTVKHPTLKTSLYQAIYKPQVELLNYLRTNGFKTFICSGGTVDFMRVVSDTLYGIPPEQVIGTELKYRYIDSAGVNDIMRLPGLTTFNDKQEKPVNIQYHIGKRPILACGNEGGAGDVYMLRFSQGNPYKSLQLIVNHDDAAREFEYSEKDNKSLNMAKQYNWQVISMKNDWKTIFP
ncbi:HAD family phosphatase [Chitinophaga sp. sic0106]|uniref:HAD family hydrolase n=1 Tax=Chitinophaga sp. sic0106 TaxID=2854785 RepID=UPI001C4945FF|nr:HAD family hydrolase [Chitinophaga sp. sic0106]MBV7533064.1 haloacid dehalogenase-like hydrolase [Chitinophaga sp. sic0106]